MNPKHCGAAFIVALLAAVPAQAQLTISTDPTSNMDCSAGVCAATAAAANLNAGEAEQALKSSDLAVSSGFSAPIEVRAPIGWSKSTTLSLGTDARITFHAPLRVNGPGGVVLSAHEDVAHGPFVTYMPGAAMTFLHLNSSLTINGERYRLVGDLQTLGELVGRHRFDNYALAHDIDAGPDGVYAGSPVNQYAGEFDGLGHDITGLRIASTHNNAYVGLFAGANWIRNVSLVDVSISATGAGAQVGALAGFCEDGGLIQVFASGTVSAPKGVAGGLAGSAHFAEIRTAMSQVNVEGAIAGGIAGGSADSEIVNSLASGSVTATDGGSAAEAGGVVGNNYNTFLALDLALGAVTGPDGALIGGVLGRNSVAQYQNDYWNTTTSGVETGCGGGTCHRRRDTKEIKGKTTKELRAHLPDGFSGEFWNYGRKTMLDGMPYLVVVPPR